MTPQKKKLLIGLSTRLVDVLADENHNKIDSSLLCEAIIRACNGYTQEIKPKQLPMYVLGDTIYVNG